MDVFAIVLFAVVGLVLSEISLKVVPAFDELTPTIVRLVAMGMGIFGGSFWYSMQHAGLALSLVMAGCVALGSVLLVRVARYLIVAGA